MMLWLFSCTEIMLLARWSILQYGLFDNVPVILLCDLFYYLAWDFGFYWLSLASQKCARLLGGTCGASSGEEHYNLSLGVRNSWYSSLTSIPFLCCWRCLVYRYRSFGGFYYSL